MLTRILLRKLAQEAQIKHSSRLPMEITEIVVDTTLPEAEQKLQYLKDAGNPYLLRFGTIQIKLVYAEDGPPISDLVADYFRKGGGQK